MIEEKPELRSPHLNVATATVRTPARPEGVTWTVVHRKGAVVIAPITRAGEIVLIRQERVPVRCTLWELPAGQVDLDGGHDAAILTETALRELREETGYALADGGAIEWIGHYFTSPGFTDEHCHLFVASPVEPVGGLRPDAGECIAAVAAFPLARWREMIAAGEIRDANTLATFAALAARGRI